MPDEEVEFEYAGTVEHNDALGTLPIAISTCCTCYALIAETNQHEHGLWHRRRR